jgi:hypothetical protein
MRPLAGKICTVGSLTQWRNGERRHSETMRVPGVLRRKICGQVTETQKKAGMNPAFPLGR